LFTVGGMGRLPVRTLGRGARRVYSTG
jgi:hypothetical protein